MSMRQANVENEELSEALQRYIYHLTMRPSTSDKALMICLSKGLQAYLPLGSKDKLCNPECPIKFSCVYGDNDWMRFCDEDYGQVCVMEQPELK